MNSFSHSYDPSSRILSIKDSTGKTVFVPKTLDGTPENWQVKTQNGQTLISYTVGGESIQHTIQGNEYRTLIGSNTVPPDFRACWEKELKSNGTFEDANVCKAENFNVAPSTPPSNPNPANPAPKTPPAPPATQPKPNPKTPKGKVYGPPTPTAEDFKKKPIPNPSPSAPVTPTSPPAKPKVEVGKSFPPNLPTGVTPYHYEREGDTLRLKQGKETLYERPYTPNSKEDPLNNPSYTYDTGFKNGSSRLSTRVGDGKLNSDIHIDPKEKNLSGNPVVSIEEQTVQSVNEHGVETLNPKTMKKTGWWGDQIETTQTAKETELKALNKEIEKPKQNLLQWQAQLREAQKKSPQDPKEIARLEQEVKWARGPYDKLVQKQKELEAAIEAEKKGGPTPTPSTTTPPVSKPWWNPLPTPTAPVLVMGVDSNGNPKDPYKGARTDTMMLIRPDTHEGDIDLVSLPRDTKVQSGGKTQKLNAAYAQGGASKILETVQNSLGVPVDKYVAFDTKIVRDVVDAIGGVEVVIKEPLKYEDKTAGLKIDIPAGDPNNGYKVRLDGKNAEHYLRYRADWKGDALGRIPRQQAFMKAAWEQSMSSPSTLAKVPSILQAVNQNLDTNMSYPELLQYLAYARQVKPSDVDSSTLKGTPGPSYWLPDANQPDLDPFKQK